jgi:Tfp pilus assembly protein PilF
MEMRALPLVLSATALLIAIDSVASQERGKEPARPKLEAGSDTNSAIEYFDHGLRLLQKKPEEAGRAFYWAQRLDPRSADPLYARRLAWFYGSPRRFFDYLRGSKYLKNDKEAQEADSLFLRALMRDPFVRGRLDRYLLELLKREYFNAGYTLQADRGDPAEVGWFALAEGRYRDAAVAYAKAIQKHPKEEFYHVQRASAFYYLGAHDSTAAEMNAAVALISERQDKKLLVVYASKAMYEYAAGHALLVGGNIDAARESFGRAAAEDLSFYMAHVRLAAIAVAQHDTAAALNEYETAVQLRGDDAALRFDYGTMLTAQGKYDEAAIQMRKAIEAEPYYAPPYVWLASIEETDDHVDSAKQLYETFVSRAPRGDARVEKVKLRLAQMTGKP